MFAAPPIVHVAGHDRAWYDRSMLWAAIGAWMLAGPADAAGPDEEAERKACVSKCDAASETDRETCRLQCEQTGSRPGVVRWKETQLLGGSTDGGTTTTVTEQHPDGSTTTTTTTRRESPGPTAPASTRPAPGQPIRPAVPRSLRADQARCQISCDPLTVSRERARCKIACLRRP
jgi:hypothetical protein